MRSLTLAALLALILLTTAGTYSAGPIYNADCTWRANGMIITNPDGTRMVCHCTFEAAVDEWWCTWMDAPESVKASRWRARHKFRESRYYGHPRVGVWLAGALVR